jgi:hypothetical protein
VARIELEEPDTAVISEIRTIDVSPDGRIVIPGRQQSQVRIYAADGRLLRSLGRRGEGPGEFKRPQSAAFAHDGRIFVVDVSQRLTRFAPSLELDTILRLQDTEFGGDVQAAGDTLVVGLVHPLRPGHEFAFYSFDGEWLGGFHDQNPLVRVPYWVGPWVEYLAVGRRFMYVAESMVYPLYRYSRDGTAADTFGAPPPSWIQASKPQPGQFMGASAMQRYERWLRTFTTIAGIFLYRDSLLLVQHEKLDPDVRAYREATYRIDIYDVASEPVTKLYEDIPVPGRILEGGDHIYVLVATPPPGWAIGKYELPRLKGLR